MAGVLLDELARDFSGGIKALVRLSLEVRDGEFLAVVGPSGSGKTTVLRLIAGLDDPTSGRIAIGGRPMHGVSPADRDVAMVFQRPGLLPHKSVRQNLAFGRRTRGQGSKEEIEAAVIDTARILGIEALLDRRPEQLSGGEQQRVALGKALIRRPAVYLFDEPLSNLDAPLREELRQVIKGLHQRLVAAADSSATMVYVTHDQAEALTLGDRVAVLDRGEIQQVAPPQQIYDSPRNTVVARFIGSPPMNLLRGHLRIKDQKTSFASRTWSVPVDRVRAELVEYRVDRDILLGVRAEDVQLATEGDQPAAAYAVPGIVCQIEPLGESTLVHVRLVESPSDDPFGSATVVSRKEARVRLTLGARTLVHFDMQRAHFFDPVTGQNVCRSEITPKGN